MLQEIADCVKSLPRKFQDEVIDMSKSIQKKLREYSEVASFKTDPQYLSMEKKHFDFVQNLRKTNPEKYKSLVYFATVYPTLDIDDQRKAAISFFSAL